VYLEKSSTKHTQYLNFSIDKTGADPHKSQWIFSKITELECSERKKGNRLSFPN
jgi:hypothetical protein